MKGEENSKTAGLAVPRADGTSRASKSPSIEEQLRERREAMKRKADQDLPREDASEEKKPSLGMRAGTAIYSSTSARPAPSSSSALHAFASSSIASSSKASSSSSGSAGSLLYPNGALRITRTPGRMGAKNTISLPDLIDKKTLRSACVFAFFIAQEELFQHLPFSTTSDDVPIYIGRDINQDHCRPLVAQGTSILSQAKISKHDIEDKIGPRLQALYKSMYGQNYHAFYPVTLGLAHSKFLVLVYPTFLRIVITSANMMDGDTVLGDNHWYIHDLPKLNKARHHASEGFESDFLGHLELLGTPSGFLDRVRGIYDWSALRVSLITSIPGIKAGPKAEDHGLLRLRRLVRGLNLKLPKKQEEGKCEVEVCAASIGLLTPQWLDGFFDCAMGRKKLEAHGKNDSADVPDDLRIVYPTMAHVKSAEEDSKHVANSIGCHLRPWDQVAEDLQRLFHHYKSRDTGRLFHAKLIMALDPSDRSAYPHYLYIGSANFSKAAWGELAQDKSKTASEAAGGMKVAAIKNFECGVFIPGTVLPSLLEAGTRDWEEAVVPYLRPAQPYDLATEKPWNDVRWVKGATSENASGAL